MSCAVVTSRTLLPKHPLVHSPEVPGVAVYAGAVLDAYTIAGRDLSEFLGGQGKDDGINLTCLRVPTHRELSIADDQHEQLALRQESSIAGKLDIHDRRAVGQLHRSHRLDAIFVVRARNTQIKRRVGRRQLGDKRYAAQAHVTLRRKADVADEDLVAAGVIEYEAH